MRHTPLLLLLACSDYGLNKNTDPDEIGEPDITASPDALDLIVCGAREVEIAVGNAGDRALFVDEVALEGEGWAMDPVEPFTVDPGQEVTLTLEAGPGEATLRLTSDDPDQPVLALPLVAVADAPPEVLIEAPADGAVVDIGVVEAFSARVADDADAPGLLGLTWASDLDGALSTRAANAEGLSTLDWEASYRSPGDHVLSLDVVDSCGNAARDAVTLCQQAGYVADELDISTWHFEGAALWDAANRQVQLTPVANNAVGTAFQTGQTVPGEAVEIRFSFFIGGGTGADGLSLTALDTTRMTTFLGGTGCGIGYGGDADCTSGPALPGWSIEVDTYYNGGQDPTEADHLMFTFDGDVDDPAFWVELPEVEDTGWHTLEVIVAAPRVTVALDEVVVMDVELEGHFAFPAYVGFTAGTGGLTNEHLIRSLEVTDFVCGG